jgi:hypothetical protein
MAELHTRFQELSATIAPLEESVRTARSAFDQCDTELVTLTKEQQLLLQDRSQLFDGRPVVIVEQEFANLVRAASEAVERAAAQRIRTPKPPCTLQSRHCTAGSAISAVEHPIR